MTISFSPEFILLQNFMYYSYFCSSDSLQFNLLFSNIDHSQRVWQKLTAAFFGTSSDSTLAELFGKIFSFAEKLHTLIFLSSRSPVRKKKSTVEIRPGLDTHVKWNCKSLRKSLPLNCLLSFPIVPPFHVTSLGNTSPSVVVLSLLSNPTFSDGSVCWC